MKKDKRKTCKKVFVNYDTIVDMILLPDSLEFERYLFTV